MLIQLPVETWIEILDWLRRRDLIKKLESLWDREFTPTVQDWLHKYTRKVKIGRLWTDNDGLSVSSCDGEWEKVPFAIVDIPGNITGFERITIKYLDSHMLAFLHRIRPLFRNIHLRINYYDNAKVVLSTQTALTILMPMINNSIESVVLDCHVLQFFSANYPTALLTAKVLGIWDYAKKEVSNGLLIRWLFTRRENGQPRTLLLYNWCEEPAGFWEKIRERFLDPTRQLASPFFVQIRNYMPNASVTENVRTGELLTIVDGGDLPYVLISNCALNNVVDPEWLAKQKEEVHEWNFFQQKQVIWLNSLQIGPLNVNVVENAEEAN